MKNIFEHIEHAKSKPHHVRKQIAFGVATGITSCIALAWFVQGISSNAFAIQGSSFADSVGQGSVVVPGAENREDNLAGVAAALRGTPVPARIEIVDVASSTRNVKQAEQTILPF